MEGTECYNKYLILIMWDTKKVLNDELFPVVYVVDKIYDDIPDIEIIKKENRMRFYKMEGKFIYKINLDYNLLRERKKMEKQEKIGKIENFKSLNDEYVDKYYEINNIKLCFYEDLSDLVMYIKFDKSCYLEYIKRKKK